LLDSVKLKEYLRWVEKEKVSEWLGLPYEEERQDANPKLVSLAKVIEEFENPKLSEEKPLFRKSKDEKLQGMSLTVGEVEDEVKDYVMAMMGEDSDFAIEDVAVIGSRTRDDAREDSDLDVLVQYSGDVREDYAFNILNEEPLYIDGVLVDINPITKGKSGTIDQFIKRNEGFTKTRLRKTKNSNNLIAVHNISESNLRKVLEMGGLIMPSIAVTDVNLGHSGYGEISLLFDKETINPSDRRNKVYGGDAWTPRFPKMEPKLNGDVVRSVRKKIEGLLDESLRAKYSLSAELHPSNIESTISNNGKLIQAFHSLMQVLCSCSLTKLQIGGKRNLHGGMKILTAFMNH
jgi:predicted nucleotidyltransferase